MDEKKDASSVFNIEGLKPIDPTVLEQFQQKMKDEVIPEIVDIVEKRQLKAAETRHWHLKC
jgi:hypothetical protein